MPQPNQQLRENADYIPEMCDELRLLAHPLRNRGVRGFSAMSADIAIDHGASKDIPIGRHQEQRFFARHRTIATGTHGQTWTSR